MTKTSGWQVVVVAAGLGVALNAYAAEAEDLTSLSIKINQGKLSSVQVLKTYQARIAALNPSVHAVIAMRPQAEEEAIFSDQQTKNVLPLHGLPILVKDNIDVRRMVTTAGSLALADNFAAADAHLVARLRAAGAIIVGKTNLSEWANFRSTKATSGWSSAGGQTRNPYALGSSPCGSSSGSGAAVAARMIPAAIGTETDGSIVCPAAVNGLVGLKPTVGLVSRGGIVPLSHSQDTAGPMTLTVRDAALLMNVLVGSDPLDPATKEADKRRATDYLAGLSKQGLRGKRLGIISKLVDDYDAPTKAVFKRSLAVLRAQGAIIVDHLVLPFLDDLEKDEMTVLLYEFKAGLNTYLAATPASVSTRNMADVIAFNKDHADTVMPFFSQEIMEQAQATGGLTDSIYLEAKNRAKLHAGINGIDATLKKYRLDALIAPTTGAAWTIDYKAGDVITGSASTPAAVAGYPHLTVPMGMVKDMPLGLSFFAGAWSDATLLKMGYAFEQARPRIAAPRLDVGKQ